MWNAIPDGIALILFYGIISIACTGAQATHFCIIPFFLIPFFGFDGPSFPIVSGVSFCVRGRFGVGYGGGRLPRAASQSKGSDADSDGLVTGEGG